MGYGSFYGGRKGASFVIVKNYKDIISMVSDFAKGNNFSQVKYDEYVLINTVNKSHPDNGKIFRRGYDYNSSRTIEGYRVFKEIDGVYQEIIDGKINGQEVSYDKVKYNFDNNISAGGAIYIGTIVGPSGNAPFLTLAPYEEVANYFNNAPEDRREFKADSIKQDDLLPGKEINDSGDTVYHDDILWYSASVIEENDNIGHAYIGFKIPYLVVDFTTKELTPYENINIKRIDSKEHPFYAQWQIAIPRGKRGNAIKNIQKINLVNYFSNEANIADLPAIYETPTSSEPMTIERFQQLGFSGKEDIVVYTYQNYDENMPPEEKICYLAQYKQIKNITITDSGDLGIVYTDNDQDLFQKAVSRITELTYNENTGFLKIAYNTGDVLQVPIIYPDKIQLKDDGRLVFKKNIEQDEVLNNPDERHIIGILKWIDNIFYDNTSRQITITYNTDENITLPVPFISDIRIQDNGQVDIRKGGEDWQPLFVSNENLTTRILKWIKRTTYNSQNNELQIYYNTDSDENPSLVIPNVFQKIENIVFRESLIINDQDSPYTGPGFEITYSDGAIQKIPFSTGNLIKSISLIPGSGYDDIQQGQPSNAKLRIEYTNTNIEQFQLDGNLISDILLTEDQIEIEEDNTTVTLPTNSLRVRYDNGFIQDFDNFIYPRSVKVYDDTVNSSHSIVFYDSQGQEISRTNPLTSIEKIKIYNNRLIALYNNPTARENIPSERVVSLLEPDGTALNWDNLGVVRADTGILVGRNFTIAEAKLQANLSEQDELTNEDIISFLNNLYQNGTILNNLYRIITVGDTNQNKKFFGYDIGDDTRASTWYYLGTIPESASSQNVVTYGTKEEFESNTDIKKASLRVGGIYFIVKDE